MLICFKGSNTAEIYKIYRRMIHFLPSQDAAALRPVAGGDNAQKRQHTHDGRLPFCWQGKKDYFTMQPASPSARGVMRPMV